MCKGDAPRRAQPPGLLGVRLKPLWGSGAPELRLYPAKRENPGTGGLSACECECACAGRVLDVCWVCVCVACVGCVCRLCVRYVLCVLHVVCHVLNVCCVYQMCVGYVHVARVLHMCCVCSMYVVCVALCVVCVLCVGCGEGTSGCAVPCFRAGDSP